MKTRSVITCPQCGFAREETMSLDACQHFYTCASEVAALADGLPEKDIEAASEAVASLKVKAVKG